MAMKRGPRILVLGLAVWMVTVSGIVLALNWINPVHRAVLGMAWGLILLWVGVCGLTMWRWREFWRRLAARVPLPWGLKFVLGCVMLMLVEEAVTTLMTNCAPLFGVKVGQAYITASANYLDVVLYHSVVAITPMFVGWAIMLWRWRFSPFAAFVLFGPDRLSGRGAHLWSQSRQSGFLGLRVRPDGVAARVLRPPGASRPPAAMVCLSAGGGDPVPVPASDGGVVALAVGDAQASPDPFSSHLLRGQMAAHITHRPIEMDRS
jgi:hypothetical protein